MLIYLKELFLKRQGMYFAGLHIFHFFGIFNIQKLGKPLIGPQKDMFEYFESFAGNDLYVDAHTFENPDNFCRKDGKLFILDYGSTKIREVLIKYEKQFSELNGF